MASLLDTLTQMQQPGATPVPVAPQQSETEKARQLLAARTGKAGAVTGAGTPAQSNVGEQVANQQTAGQMAQVQQGVGIQQAQQQQQAASVEEQARQQAQQTEQQRKAQNLQFRLQSNQIINDLQRSGQKLDLQRDQATAEQAGFTTRLATKSYTDRLEQEGAKLRLDNELGFRKQLEEQTFGANLELLKQKLANQSVLNTNTRDFSNAMARISINDAITVARNTIRAENQRSQWEATGGVVKGGIEGAQKYYDYKERHPDTSGGEG